MSLKEAVLDIVEQMEEEYGRLSYEQVDAVYPSILLPYVKMLKLVCKSAGDSPPMPSPQQYLTPEAQHRTMIDAAREQIRAQKASRGEPLAEEHEVRMIIIADGPSAGVLFAVDSTMPVGAYCAIGGKRYRLDADNQLHIAPEIATK